MKVLLFFFCFLMANAFAESLPIIVKHSGSGFVPDEWYRFEKCQVFDHEVLISRKYGDTTVNFQIPFSADDSLRELIAKASEEEIEETPNYMCDGPSTTVKAYDPFEGETTDVRGIVLYSTGGCGSNKQVRNGPYSAALIDMVSTFCPTIH